MTIKITDIRIFFINGTVADHRINLEDDKEFETKEEVKAYREKLEAHHLKNNKEYTSVEVYFNTETK